MNKDFQRLIEYHWHIVFGWIKAYYPMPMDIIDDYIDEFSLHRYHHRDYLSVVAKNESIVWTKDMLFKHKALFQHSEIFKNENIVWDKELVDYFSDIISWYMLSLNKNLAITENLLDAYQDKINWKCIIINPRWTEVLKDKYGHHVNSWDLSKLPIPNKPYIRSISSHLGGKAEDIALLEKLNINAEKLANDLTLEEIKKLGDRIFEARIWNEIECMDFNFFFQNWHKFKGGISKSTYRNLVKPYLDDNTLRSILQEKYPSKQRYYYLLPGHDKHGLVPRINDAIARKENEPIGDFFLDEDTIFSLELDYSFEGPERLVDLHGFRNDGATLMISDTLKELLSNFKLPEHRYYKAIFKSSNPKINNQIRWLLHLTYDSLIKDMDYAVK